MKKYVRIGAKYFLPLPLRAKYFLPLLVLWVLTGCASLSKLVEKHQYDKAVAKGMNLFKNPNQRKAEDVQAMETAYNELVKRDLAMVQHLKDENREENWTRINGVYKTIEGRQAAVQTISPLVDETGRKANFNFVNVRAELNESTAKSAELYYNKGVQLLNESFAQNDRFKAREAYAQFQQMEQYDKNFKDGQAQKQNAKEQGMTSVLLGVVNSSGRNFANFNFVDTLYMGKPFENSEWIRYVRQDAGKPIHYHITVTVQSATATPNTNDNLDTTQIAMVQDGVEYVRDANGQLVLDAQGNPTTKPKMVKVSNVTRITRQHKTATITALVDILDRGTQKSLGQQAVSASKTFEHFTAKMISGDPRAHSADIQAKIKAMAVAFPADDELILQALPRLAKPTKDFIGTKVGSIK